MTELSNVISRIFCWRRDPASVHRQQEKLEDDSLNFDQLMSLYRSLGNENNVAADGILSLFKDEEIKRPLSMPAPRNCR
jgi:hypothetical protein